MNFKRIGLTGGPGCGKSEAARIFSEFNQWRCFDADRICHEIYAQAHSPLVELATTRWGGRVADGDGRLIKTAVAEKVFGDETERLWLESVLHPEILRRLETAAEQAEVPFILFEVPLLFESGWAGKMDRTIAVWSPRELQMERLLRRGWTIEQAQKRIAAQWSADKKLELADYGLINQSSLELLREQCERLDHEIKTTMTIKQKTIRS